MKTPFKLITTAKDDFNYTLNLNLTKNSTNTIVRNLYESFRMLGEALLLNKDIKTLDHIKQIDELIRLNMMDADLELLFDLQELRHNINHKGHKATINQAKDVLNFSRFYFEPVFIEVEERLKRK